MVCKHFGYVSMYYCLLLSINIIVLVIVKYGNESDARLRGQLISEIPACLIGCIPDRALCYARTAKLPDASCFGARWSRCHCGYG